MIWIIFILVGVVGLGLNTLKKYTMVGFGRIELKEALNISTWLRLFSNPMAILSLGISLFGWVMSMWTFSLAPMGQLNALAMGISIPFLFLNMLVGILLFKENFGKDQMIGLSIISMAMILSIAGAYVAGGGFKA